MGWGKMSMVGQSRSLEIFICMPKIRKPMVIRSTCLFSHWNRKSKTDDHVIVSSLAFNSETKISSDSLCPTPPYPNQSWALSKKAVQLIPLRAGLRPRLLNIYYVTCFRYKGTHNMAWITAFLYCPCRINILRA